MGACQHLLEFADTTPPASGLEPGAPDALCPDCRDIGATAWAHLRRCVACGHVGCCDSSPHRHAAAHHDATGHPVMQSFEPGETWRWCYVDRRLAV